MYFSKNSRCVLQRARFLSPSFLKTGQQNLSIKKPLDDPTKPPLRVNIPEDLPQNDVYTKLIQNSLGVSESRSKGLIKRSKSTSLSPSFDDDFLVKSESEIQFSKHGDDKVGKDIINKETISSQTLQTVNSSLENLNENKEDHSDGFQITPGKEARESAVSENYVTTDVAVKNRNYTISGKEVKKKSVKIPIENQTEDSSSPNSLYIIIDVPRKSDKNFTSEEVPRSSKDESVSFKNQTSTLESVKTSSMGKNGQKTGNTLLKKSNSFSKFDSTKTKLKKKFEVHEIEDECTYIFHLKFNPNPCKKPCGVGWVPEKEVTTRNENFSCDNTPIKMREPNDPRFSGLRKEKITANELPKLFKYPSNKRKIPEKLFESGSKANLLAVDKEYLYEPPECKRETGASHEMTASNPDQNTSDSQPGNMTKIVSHNKEERKNPQRFERDDFGSIRSGVKNYPYKVPGKSNDTKQGENGLQESSSATDKVNKQEVYAEASSNPSTAMSETDMTEMAKDEKKVVSENHVNTSTFSESRAKSHSPDKQQQNYENRAIHVTDSYIQYLDTHRKSPSHQKSSSSIKPSEKPSETNKKSKTSDYLSIHDKEPVQSQPLFQHRSNYTRYYIAKEAEQVRRPASSEYKQNSDEKEYLTIREKPKTSTLETSIEINRKKSDSQYINVPKDVSNRKAQKSIKNPQSSKKPLKKKLSENSEQEKSDVKHSKSAGFEKLENEAPDFQTCASFVSIGYDRISSSPMMFGAAFPPLLGEALNSRFRLKRDFLLTTNWNKTEIGPKNASSDFSQKYKVPELSETSILFPKKESEKFDCDSLFNSKEEIILNIIKNEEENISKISDNVAIVASEKLTEHQGNPSVDSLTMMKKVKEIVQFDLDNAVKIFSSGGNDSAKDLSSVVVLKENSWQVDNEELGKQIQMRKNEAEMASWIDSTPEENARLNKDILGDKIENKSPKYLPSKEKNLIEMKLDEDHSDSVITFNPKTNEFSINKEALANAISRRTSESFEEVSQTLDLLAKSSENSLKAKSGDSILVFDEETQSWKVDFSILEKREQQLQMEKELTKRSELILETFEKLEKGQMSTVPVPGSKDKKTFDYKTEKWKVYDEEKNSKEKSTKSKSPFRESNAEEIRRKNSDLYDDLFIAKKKETTMKKAEKTAPGLDSSKTTKESKSGSSGEKKETSESSSMKKSGSAPQNPNPPKPETKLPGIKQEKPTKKEDDNYWDSFLKMNILPRDFREIPNIAPSRKPISPPIPKQPTGISPKIEEPKSKGPEKKIEEPKLKKPESKIEEPKLKKPESKIEEPKLKKPESKIEEPKLKKPESKIEEPKLKKPESKIEEPKLKKTPEKKIEEPRFKFHLPLIRNRRVDIPLTLIKSVPKEKTKTTDEKKVPSPSGAGPEKKETPEQKAPPQAISTPKNDPKNPPKTTSSKEPPKPAAVSDKIPPNKIQDPQGKNEKSASAADHYLSDKIIEISRNKTKDNQPKIKTNKMETVKLNITTDKRLPSKVTEINLNKNYEEKVKESTETEQDSLTAKKSTDGALIKNEKHSESNKPLYKNLEKYKTSFSDPEYEEKSMKIKSDIDSNPNLKKLDSWNKTLVLHDIMKPPENIDAWLKDETDKMATLLLKILQEASDGRPKKKQPLNKTKSGEKHSGKGNPYENIRKKQEVTPEKFLFRVETVNLLREDNKKGKSEEVKVTIKSEKRKDMPGWPGKNAKFPELVDAVKFVTFEKGALAPMTGANIKGVQLPENLDASKSKASETALETIGDPALTVGEFSQQNKFSAEITDEIPGPEILKKISNTWKVFPILGSQMTIFTLLRVFQLVNLGSSVFGTSILDRNKRFAFSKLFKKYGPIVNVQGPLSGNVILIHKPEHLAAVFDQDSAILVRSVFDSLEQSRHDSEEKLFSVNISTDWTRPEWNELKKGTEDPLFRGSEKYFRTVEVVGDSLVSNIRKNKNSQDLVSDDFMEEIKKWSLEGLCNVLFEKSFGFLEGKTSNISWIMEPDKLYMAVDEATRCLSNCERGFQLWRLMATSSATGLGRAYRVMSAILTKQLYQAEVNLKNKSEVLKDWVLFPTRELTFTEGMLLNDGMTTEEITCNLVDIMLIGTNTMNSAMGFLLYNLAQNVKIQAKLLKELKEALPHKSSLLDYNKLNSLKYLRACLKESLRLHIPIPVFYRMLQNDILLANYIVPKGTCVVMDYRVSCMKEQIFDEPDKYVPERWLNDEKWMYEIHPFNSLPLCHGPRAELAKKVIEMQLLTCVAKIVRNFKIEYHYGEIHGTDSLITLPDKPLKLSFVERDS